MIRLYIIFGILGYIIPATIIARVFYARTLQKMYRAISVEVVKEFENKPQSRALAERTRRENAKGSLQLGIIFVFLLWPVFLIGMLITGEKNDAKDIEILEVERAKLQDLIIFWSTQPKGDFVNVGVSLELLKQQLHEVESKLKQYE